MSRRRKNPPSVTSITRPVRLTERLFTMSLLLLIVLIAFLVGGLPRCGHHSYGYAPSGLVGVLVIILLVLILTGRF